MGDRGGAPGAAGRPTVVLLHGLGRTARSLAGLRRALEAAGWPTWARTYPSRREPLAALVDRIEAWLREDLPPGPLVAVTHSLGGILARHLAGRLPFEALCMLAPPSQGSAVARRLRGWGAYRALYGPAGQEVASADGWPVPDVPTAVIAGDAGATLGNPLSLVTSRLLPRGAASDGTVAVAETRLPGPAEHAVVRASHTWIMDHPEARALVLRFLERRTLRAG